MADFHVQITNELNDRINQYYQSNGLTKSQGIRNLLELGLYKMFEEEVEYGEVESKQINS